MGKGGRRVSSWLRSHAIFLCLAGSLAALNGAVQAQAQTSSKTVKQVDFGAELFGESATTSAPRTLPVSTGCEGAICGGDGSDFFLKITSRHPGGREVDCHYSVTFSPHALGTRTAQFGFLSINRGFPCQIVLDLVGKGVPPALQSHPSTLDFGRAALQTNGVFKQINLVNSTKVGIGIGVISSSNPDFVPAQYCADSVIDPHSSCTVSVAFKPSSVGTESGKILIAGDQSGSPRAISVSGVGVSGPPPCTNGVCGKVVSGFSTAIAKSAVTLYATGPAYEAGATALASAITNANGNFTLSSFTCPAADSQTYIIATGGDAGAGTNPAIGLAAALGPCGHLGSSTDVVINELTTVATEWAFAQFTDTSGQILGAPASNSTGLQIGYASFANLADVEASNDSLSGEPSGFLTSAPCGASSSVTNDEPLERLDTLADILASCVESKSSSSGACGTLFADSGASTTMTTLAIAHAIASNPDNNAAEIFALLTKPTDGPFQPALTTVPDGWEPVLNFSPQVAGLRFPQGMAVDAAGNVWAANPGIGTVSELPVGNYACGASSLAVAASQVAFDNEGNLWLANGGITELPGGRLMDAVNFTPANTPGANINRVNQIALDTAGSLWFADDIDGVSELPVGNYGPGATNYNFGNSAFSLAFDPFGNLWVANDQGVSELLKGNYSQAINYPITKQFYPFLGMATDAAGNIWVPDFTGVTELPVGNYEMGQLSYAPRGFNCDPGFGACPDAIAIDGAGNVWLAGDSTLAVAELSAANYNLTPLRYTTFRGTTVDLYTSLAIDAAGNVWVTNQGSSYASELVGVAKPVMTPLQNCLAFETNNPGQACVP